PPLCSAFVRSSTWFLHLDFSVRIAAPGSHVPRSCLLTDSGLLNAGCRSVRKQVFAGADPTVTNPRGFDIVSFVSTCHQWFPCGPLSVWHLTCFSQALSSCAHDPDF